MLADNKYMLIGVAVAALALVVLVKKKGAAADVGLAVGEAAANLAGGVVGGVALGIGDQIGIPRTNMTQCEKDLADGKTWDASFSCPASTWLGSLF
jgi:branched-subunit amino acid permease